MLRRDEVHSDRRFVITFDSFWAVTLAKAHVVLALHLPVLNNAHLVARLVYQNQQRLSWRYRYATMRGNESGRLRIVLLNPADVLAIGRWPVSWSQRLVPSQFKM